MFLQRAESQNPTYTYTDTVAVLGKVRNEKLMMLRAPAVKY